MKKKIIIKDQRGAAVVEFAIVLPLLVLMVIGICEFGLLWYNSQVIINASREGARAAITRSADASSGGITVFNSNSNAKCNRNGRFQVWYYKGPDI